MSIGYELLITPLQLLTFYNAVANDGRMMKPYLVQRVEHYGEVLRTFRPVVLQKSIADKNTLRKARRLLESVVEDGTASNIRSPYLKLAGKTGTAQLNYHKFRSEAGIRYQAGFAGYFPADRPYYSCIVVISEPKRGGYHGAEAAAPVFRTIAEACYALKPELHLAVNAAPRPKPATNKLPGMHAGRTDDLKSSIDWLQLPLYARVSDEHAWGVLRAENNTVQVLKRTVPDRAVPSVVGMGLKDALYLLENRGCRVRVQGVGKVRQQSLAPGTPITRNAPITLYLN
jgi:cell division protein FtsI (penicillin-binding protein 3)